MQPVVISDILAVGEFPQLDQLEILANAGFKAIINNQPDGEVARFPLSAQMAAKVEALGLAYAFAPLSSRTPSADEITRYAHALRTLPEPIYAFCYSGARAAAGYALIAAADTEVDQVISNFAAAGFNIEGLRPWLEDSYAHGTGKAADMNAQNNESRPPESLPRDSTAKAAAAVPGAANPSAPIVVFPRAAGFGGFAI